MEKVKALHENKYAVYYNEALWLRNKVLGIAVSV